MYLHKVKLFIQMLLYKLIILQFIAIRYKFWFYEWIRKFERDRKFIKKYYKDKKILLRFNST
jgi:hypothetical protein